LEFKKTIFVAMVKIKTRS